MTIEGFQKGTYQQQFRYRSYQPPLVNHQWTWDSPELHDLLSNANRHLGELNGLSLIVPDVDRFIQMHVVKEAQTSSRIEGTQTEMDEALEEDPEEIAPEKRDDWREVRNYIEAMNQSVERLKTLPLSNRLLCEAHRTLLKGVRGEGKTPGEFRRSQNWIGGATLADAVFIPPHHEEVPALMSDLEAFWHNETIAVPELIRIGISHYQFETIHPFLDGNGRIGRLLIALYLVSKGLLHRPCLYLSAHLEQHRAAYYDALTAVRTRGDLMHWIKFFLVAINETARKGVLTFQSIHEMRQRTAAQIQTLGKRSGNASRLLESLFAKPVVTSAGLSSRLDLSQPTVDRLLSDLRRLGIVHELTGKRRNRVFYFKEYYQLFAS
ncbi:Fic family protein [Prosthecobacter debontii]|uniref:Fic family protein n=1 Tax=Prosthecobacter debontii TaxID=48467 RepID=A0A1T4XX87_9BACT|nr:Fic family protein [Prosthecobacter debontii]SKA94192.1 Fic family protein [Prosthecobacter debontii]